MTAQATLIATGKSGAEIISASLLDNLAARMRSNGVFLAMLRPDGSVAWHDSNASLFFQRFALPMLQYPEPGSPLREKLDLLTAASTVDVWNVLPGVVIGAF